MIYLNIYLNLYTPPTQYLVFLRLPKAQSGEILELASEKRNVPDVTITHCSN